ncbi:MAG: hypothetical protein NVSMB5_08060 [Candidatus Velthaea sp.]
MNHVQATGYTGPVHLARFRASRLLAAWALFVIGFFSLPVPAAATTLSYDVGDQAFVHILGRQAIISVHTWEKNAVQVEWPDGEPVTVFKGAQNWNGAPIPVPARPVKEHLPGNQIVDAVLPPEEFPVTGIATGLHDSIRIVEALAPAQSELVRPQTELTHITVTIPASAKIVDLRDGRGAIFFSDYHGNTFVNAAGARVVLTNVSGDAFVQAISGHLYAIDSNFDHLRARSNGADLVFERCRIKQIEANTLTGQIVYDNGSFEPGLARFESDRGNVALGVNGAAQLGAHTLDGRIFSALAGKNAMNGSATDATAIVGGGGPIVNASSTHGNVYMYEGSIADRRVLASEWRTVSGTLLGKRRQHFGPNSAARPREQAQPPQTPAKVDRRPRLRRLQTPKAKIYAALRRPT